MGKMMANMEGYYFVSDNKIRYTLMEGMSINGEKRYSYDTLTIFFDVSNNINGPFESMLDEMFDDMFGDMRILVDYFQIGVDDLILISDDIEECINRFEKEHNDMVEFIIEAREKEEYNDMVEFIIKSREKKDTMGKENDVVTIKKEEYTSLKDKIHQLEADLDMASMELFTYRRSIQKVVERNLYGEKNERTPIEIPAKDFVSLIEQLLNNSDEEKFQTLSETDIVVNWEGISTRLMFGPEIFEYLLPSIEKTYEEIHC